MALTPQALHHWEHSDQVNALLEAREAEPDTGFMMRLLALCTLPRTNPGTRDRYVRRNGPFALIMIAGGEIPKLPYGTLPRLLLAWCCTEAVRTQSRTLVLGRSLAEFMRQLGGPIERQRGALGRADAGCGTRWTAYSAARSS